MQKYINKSDRMDVYQWLVMNQKSMIMSVMKDWTDVTDRITIVQQCLSFMNHTEYYKIWYFKDKIIIWKYDSYDPIYMDDRSGKLTSWELDYEIYWIS